MNVTGGFASALDWPDQTLVLRYPGLLAGSIADSISGGSIGPTAKSGPNQTPLFGFRSLQRFPVSSACFLKAASFQFIPLRRSKSSLRFWAPSVIRSLAFASCILSVREVPSCAIGLSLDSVPLRISRRRSWSMSGIAPSLLGVNR